MSWFNTYPRDRKGLVRKVVIEVNLRTLPITEWTTDELGLRLAVLFPEVDGYGHENATPAVMDEIEALMAELRSRGLDPVSNLMYNERCTGWGWLSGWTPLERTPA